MSKLTIDSLKNSKGLQLNKRVFVVHGNNDKLKFSVTQFLQKLQLSSVVLNEHPNSGLAFVENIEKHANDCYFAIVLLTGDEVGGERGAPESDLTIRARQDVILELGYFIGYLKRGHVAVIYEPGVDIPKEYGGILFLSADDEWQTKLAKEMKKSGLSVDLNLLG